MIPKKIHYCWLSGDPYPELIQRCIDSWHKYLPDYEYILWDKSKFDIESILWVKEAYESKKYAFAADYIRLYALYTEGGIYLDSDVEVLKDFEPLLTHKSFIGQESIYETVEPAIIGAEPGMEWIKYCLDYYRNKSFYLSSGKPNTYPLPYIVTNIIKTYQHNKSLQEMPVIFPSDYFSPKNMKSGHINLTTNTYTIHHYDGSWYKHSILVRLKNIIHVSLIAILGKWIYQKLMMIFYQYRNRKKR
jgi:mannosyltransferase OCH1-like enzyme